MITKINNIMMIVLIEVIMMILITVMIMIMIMIMRDWKKLILIGLFGDDDDDDEPEKEGDPGFKIILKENKLAMIYFSYLPPVYYLHSNAQ